MKICITSQGEDISSQVDPRFGRARYFAYFDTEDESVRVHENSALSGAHGVGVQVGQMMAKNKVDVVLTGKVGPNAAEVLQGAGIEIISGVQGTVEEVFRSYTSGAFSESLPVD